VWCGSTTAGTSGEEDSRGRERAAGEGTGVFYVHNIKKVASYAHAMKKFPRTCMPLT
jgi:hypothetical protein